MPSTQRTRAESGESGEAGRRRPHRPEGAKPRVPMTVSGGQQELHSACNNEPLKVSEKADMIRSLI